MVLSLVIRSTAPVAEAEIFEISWAIFKSIESPSLICGVMVRLTPTCSRCIVWKGFTAPPVPPVFENEPVTNGTS